MSVHLTPAPMHQQAPPTRAAASDSWRSLRVARGSLPLMPGDSLHRANQTKVKKQAAWLDGIGEH
jgi:hypothetical protein